MTDKSSVALGCGVIIAAILVIALSLFVTPLFLMWTWNLAICTLFPTLPLMSYWVAFGANIFLNIIGNKFVNTGINEQLNKISERLKD